MKEQEKKEKAEAKKSITVSEWLDIWNNDFKYMRLKPSTRSNYYFCIKTHLKPNFDIPIGDLTTTYAQSVLNKLENSKTEESLSAATIVKCRNILNAAMKMAAKLKYVPFNPVEETVPPVIDTGEINVFTKEEQQTFINTLSGHRLEALFVTALATGMRRGELTALRWEDLDFENEIIHIKRTASRISNAQKGGTEWVEGTPKTKTSARVIPMPESLPQLLTEQRNFQVAEKMIAGSAWNNDNLVFCSSVGTYLEARNINRAMKQICERAGVTQLSFHALRHTFTTRMIEKEVPGKVLQEILGHADGQMTDRYTHVIGSTARDQMNKVNTTIERTAKENPQFRRQSQPHNTRKKSEMVR